jgi:hypothetical protein
MNRVAYDQVRSDEPADWVSDPRERTLEALHRAGELLDVPVGVESDSDQERTDSRGRNPEGGAQRFGYALEGLLRKADAEGVPRDRLADVLDQYADAARVGDPFAFGEPEDQP